MSEPENVIPPRLELGTHSLEGCCSIQLSYGTSKNLHAVRAGRNGVQIYGYLMDFKNYRLILTTPVTDVSALPLNQQHL